MQKLRYCGRREDALSRMFSGIGAWGKESREERVMADEEDLRILFTRVRGAKDIRLCIWRLHLQTDLRLEQCYYGVEHAV